MRSTLFNRRRRELVTSILLVAVVFHALIPAGFMPASGTPFSLTICRPEFPAPPAPLNTGRQPGNPPHTEHCAFGNAPAAGPAMETGRVLPIPVTAAEPILLLSEPLHLNVGPVRDRKSTRLNSSHLVISYAVFCLKKKKKQRDSDHRNVAVA